MFRIAAIIGIVGSLIIIALHLVMRSAQKDEQVEPAPPCAMGKFRKLIYMLIYLAAAGSFAILALSGFVAAIGWGGPMHGYLLMLHCTVAPVFCIALVALGCIWAQRCRFTVQDWQRCESLCGKLCFWLTLLLGIPLIFSIVISMLPIFGTAGQEFFYHVHRWSALAITITSILLIYFTVASRPCSKWFKKIFVSDKTSELPPSRNGAKSAPTVPADIGPCPVVLPDNLHRLLESHLADPAEENGRIGNELRDTGQFEKALPRLLAHAAQTSNAGSLFLAGDCCKQIVTNAATNETANDDHDMVLSAGIHLIDAFLKSIENDDSFPKHGEPYSVRADLFLIKAQWDRDKIALDCAKRDYKTAIKLGSTDPSNFTVWKNNLGSVVTVRKTLF